MKSRSRRLVLVLTLLLFPALRAARAQEIGPKLWSGMRWRMIGPFRAGRATAVAGVPGDPATYYFGTAGGGVWKSTDGGTVWKPIFDQTGVASIGALALAPSDPKILYVGTGENSVYSDMSHGNGVYKSVDAGATWQRVGLEDSRHVGRILVDPRNPNLVLVAALGHTFGPSPERGVFRSTDGARTWKKVLYKDDATGAVDLCFEPGNPRVVYATLWHAIRKPGQRGTSYGPGSGLYKSIDEGLTWKQIAGHGLPGGEWGRSGVAVAAGLGGRRVYLILEAKKDSGLYRSDDAGESWQRITKDERIRGSWFFGEVTADPRNPELVYVPETSVYRSEDGGKSFVSLKGAPGGDDYHAVWVDPENPRRIFLGVDQGATFSLDGGQSWSTWYNQPTAQFYHVATDHRWPYWVYGPQQDSGTMAVASRGDYGQITERDWYPVGGGESGYTIPDAANPDIVWNAGPGGSLVRFSRTTGQVQDVSPAPVLLGSKIRFNWSMPLAFSPQDPHVLYLGTQSLLKTADSGMSWQTLSPDLTRTVMTPEEEAAEKKLPREKRKIRGTLTTVAPSPVREGVIWTGSNDGAVQVTEDGGATWQNVTPPDLPVWSYISQIESSHFEAGGAYVAVSRNDLDDLRPYVYRTRDYGKTWAMVAGGIGAADYVHAVREDPVRQGLLYAATEGGVYVSFDDGEHWQSLTLNLPPVRVSDLAVEQGDLVAGTYGRSFWILDDVSPLRETSAQVAKSAAHLFAPRLAVRVRRDENQDTPLPPEIPAGQNPPDGAILDYWLGSAPAGEITLGIYDHEGKLVHEFSSAPLAAERGEPPYVPTYWLAHPEPLAKSPGMHRFVWDLRYPDPQYIVEQSPYNYPIAAIFGATPAVPQGPMVLPGKYEVRLSVNGQTYRQALEVGMDPRVNWTRDALERQQRLELEISETLGRNFAAHQQVKELGARLDELAKRPKGDAAGTAAEALAKKVGALEGGPVEILETPDRASFAALNDAFIGLMQAVDGADLGPTAAQQESFQQTCEKLNAGLAQWQELKQKDVAEFRTRLEQQKLPALPQWPEVKAAACGK